MEGERIEGCWPKDGGSNRRKRLRGEAERIFLHGMPVQLKDLTIVPHYKMWDPSEAFDPTGDEDSKEAEDQISLAPDEGPRMPYQSRREPLSRQTWLALYKEVAPRVQKELDDVVENTINAGKKAGALGCEHKLGKRVGEDIPGMIEKATSIQNACLQMQETANRIAVKDANPGFPQTGSHCTMNDRHSEPGECDSLNCYTTDAKFKKAIAALKKRNEKCYDEWEATVDQAANQCSKAPKAPPAAKPLPPGVAALASVAGQPPPKEAAAAAPATAPAGAVPSPKESSSAAVAFFTGASVGERSRAERMRCFL